MKTLAAALTLALLTAGAHAQSVQTGYGFEFTPPPGWETMPDDVMAYMAMLEDSMQTGSAAAGFFAAGAASPGGETWLALPYILIRLDTVGMLHTDQLREFIEAGEFTATADQRARLREIGMLEAGGGTDMVWDAELNAGIGHLAMIRQDGVTVHGAQFVRPYRDGLVSAFYYYDPADVSWAEAKAEVSRVGGSIEMAPSLAYDAAAARAAMARSSRTSMGLWERIIAGAIVGALFGGLATLIGGGRKKKQAGG